MWTTGGSAVEVSGAPFLDQALLSSRLSRDTIVSKLACISARNAGSPRPFQRPRRTGRDVA
jgi:hypothetical protein